MRQTIIEDKNMNKTYVVGVKTGTIVTCLLSEAVAIYKATELNTYAEGTPREYSVACPVRI
jgi:hypothetical protein